MKGDKASLDEGGSRVFAGRAGVVLEGVHIEPDARRRRGRGRKRALFQLPSDLASSKSSFLSLPPSSPSFPRPKLLLALFATRFPPINDAHTPPPRPTSHAFPFPLLPHTPLLPSRSFVPSQVHPDPPPSLLLAPSLSPDQIPPRSRLGP